ncbi:hypothetical protein NP233_g8752 [Leucocoprinus birnbaumii]|uniref:SHSP domain-containing protein n=1 Tax=Leucocoprinus birnbaumii TaxID=56174 RepID=A0AAD5VLY7_9AGAR|nr:hypothetical protein NP233_g8752 [Leucocoprinus birnbaumii]
MSTATPSSVPSKNLKPSSQQVSVQYREAVKRGVRSTVEKLIQSGKLRPAIRTNTQCGGNWKPRMNLVDDPTLSSITAIFELPGVKNENITLQIKDQRLVVVGHRVDPYTEALANLKARSEQASSGNVSNVAPQTSGPTRTGAGDSTTPTIMTPSINKSVRELRYGSFFRSIPVPEGIKQSEVTAGIQDGMLSVTWPRVPAAARLSESTPLSNATNTAGNTIHSNPIGHTPISTDNTPMLQ